MKNLGILLSVLRRREGRLHGREILTALARVGAAAAVMGACLEGARRWLDLEEDEFYESFYCASVTRCYPGRAPSGRGDRTPTPGEQELCSFWLDWELKLLRPDLIVPVGGLAIRRLLGISGLAECIGRRYELEGAAVVPLPHPSGASSWLNSPANRELTAQAASLVREELARL